MALLEVTNLGISFGGLQAVSGFRLSVDSGHLYGLIGPNGAGKTTAFNMLTGMYEPDEGKIILDGVDITGKSPEFISKAGIARTFQNIRLFKKMTVFDNVLIARHLRSKANFMSATLRLNAAEEKHNREKTLELLELVGLAENKDDLATSLPYGKQRRLEIARALATEPRLLLLDEPAAGMNPQETIELAHFIRKIKDQFNLTVFVIEHHMDLVMEISDRIYVLDFGRMIAAGTPAEIQSNQHVIDAYLGVQEE